MPCCNKRRRVIEARRRVLEQSSKKIYSSIRDKNPTSLNDKLLLDYHKKTHMLYAGAMGETGEQIAQTFHFTLDQESLHPAESFPHSLHNIHIPMHIFLSRPLIP